MAILNDGGANPVNPEVTQARNRVAAEQASTWTNDLLPEENMSAKSQADRELNRGQVEGQNARKWLEDASRIEQGRPMLNGQVAPLTAAPAARAKAAQVIADSLKRRESGSILQYPTLIKAAVQAAANGMDINAADLLRLTNYSEVDRAANMFLNAPDDTRRKNILMTADPVMRMAILDVVDARSKDFLSTLETADQNWFVEQLGNVVGTALKPFEALNEGAQHVFRAGLAGSGDGSVLGNYMSSFAPASALAGVPNNWASTERGQFDQTYINTLKASGKYDPVAVDVMSAIAKAQSEGDADPIVTVMAQFADVPEASQIIRQLIYRPEANPQFEELGRQIDSANMGSTGQLYTTHFTTPDSADFSEFRGLKAREVGSNAASIFYTFALDPTIAGSKLVGAYRVGRYALSKMAPGKSAAIALKSTKIAGVETNRARVFVTQFTSDLVKLDKLHSEDPVKAAAFRQVMARHYKEFPEDVIEEFRTQGVRSTESFIQFIDDTNDTFLVAHGQPASWTNQLQHGIPKGYESPLTETPFFDRLHSAGDMGRREALMPRKSPVRNLRESAVQSINSRLMPEARAKAVIAANYGDVSTSNIVQALDNNTDVVTGIGRMDQMNGIMDPVAGGFGRRVDGITRLFSSLPNKGQIYTGDARDAGVFYKFARSFLTKRHADVLTDAFRDANPGQRRLMVAGVIRTAAGARGVSLSRGDVLAKIDDLATGTREGELYSANQVREAAPTGDVLTDVENTVTYRPSNVNGHEHALHLWQTTEAVHIPSIRELESLKAYRAIVHDGLQSAPQAVPDARWLGSLYGLRFALRSSSEDLWSYAITAGRVPYLYKGRRASTAMRDARPNMDLKRYKTNFGSHKKGDPILDENGNVQIVLKSRLGMFGKKARKIGDRADNGTGLTSQIVGAFMLGNIDSDRILLAQRAAREGDWKPTRELIGEAMSRQRLTTFSAQDIEDFKDLANTTFGLKQMDELAETSRYINQGGYPVFAGSDKPGIADAVIPANPKTVFGDFIDVPAGDANYGLFWFRNLQGVMEADGVIGKLAVSTIEDPALARRIVADAIRKDTTFGYKDQFSALYTGELTIDEFAARYVDDVRSMFSGSDGQLNTSLLDKVAPVGDDGRRVVSLYDKTDGETVLRITPQTLGAYRKSGAPDYVLGRTTIEMPKNETALFDKAWGWMGEQYARIAREPVFLANYKEQRNILRGYEQAMSDAIGPDAARAHTARMASDRAYGYTLSYVDNPENRSQLAWKVRNVSRYYRATEDFYRRAYRMGKNYPEGFWKTALTYQVLDDTGFVFTDDNGDKYFAYPGNEFLQSLVSQVISPLVGTQNMNIDPFFMGGKVKMLAPSTDPNQAFPQVMGPLGVLGSSFIFDRFPAIQGLERYVTGEYAQGQSWYEVFFPSAVVRAMNSLSDDERQSMYGNAVMDAFAIAAAEGLIPEKTKDGVPIESFDQLQQTDEYAAINRIAWAGVVTRGLMGYIVPASPQMYVDNVTDYARAHGVTSMRGAFLDLIKSKGDSDNPVGEAFRDWWRLNPKGDLMPFTVSKTMNTPNKINQLADVQAVDGLRTWYKQNEGLYKKYPNAALLLAPRDGEFAWGSWKLITSTLGLKEGKGFEDFMTDVLVSKTQAQHYSTYDDYQRDIDKLDPNVPEQLAQIGELDKQRRADLKWLRDNNPMWQKKYNETHNSGQQDSYAQIVYNQTRIMVDDLKSRGVDTPASRAIRSAILTYEDYMSDIKGITGSTNAEDAQKRAWKSQLAADLQTIADRDPNAKTFIDNVLYRTPEMGGER